MRNRLLLMSQILLFVLILISILARNSGASVFLFWPSLWAMIIITSFMVFKSKRNYKLLALLILIIALALIPIAALPEVYQIGRDSAFEVQYSEIIVEEGRWDPELGVGFAQNYYGYNPALHLVLGLTSLATGVNAFVLGKYFFFILFRILLATLVYLIISELLKNQETAMVATMIFIGSAGAAFIGLTRRSMASVFLALAVYALIKRGRWSIVFAIASALVVISNHTIGYYFLIFLAGAWVFSMFLKLFKKKFPRMTLPLLYYVTVFLLWELNFNVLLKNDAHYVQDIMTTVLSGAGLASFMGSGGAGIDIYHPYETFVIYLAQFMFIALGVVGFILYLRKAKPNFLAYLSIFGFSMYAFSAVLMRTDLDIAVIIILWFFGIPICISVAYLLERFKTIKIPLTILVMLLFFSGSLLMGIYTPRLTNRLPGIDVSIGSDMRSKSAEVYYSGLWLSENSAGNNVIGDVDIYETYSGFFRFNVNPSNSSLFRIYQGDSKEVTYMINRDNIRFGAYRHTRFNASADYFVLNRAFSRHYSETFGLPIEIDTSILDAESKLDRIYSNKEIHIYQVNR